MLDGSVSNAVKSINEIAQSFTLNVIDQKPYFDLKVDNEKIGEEYFEKLNKDAKKYALEDDLFKWSSQTLTIRVTKKDFIRWQKAVLSRKFEGKKKISPNVRTFYKCGDTFLTIPLEKEHPRTLKDHLTRNARERDLNISFKYNEQDGAIEISSEDYLLFKNFSGVTSIRVPFHKREFKKDEKRNCYFTHPVNGESLPQLRMVLKRALKRKKTKAEVTINTELNSVEISDTIFPLIAQLKDKSSLSKISVTKREFHEKEDYFYVTPREKETLDDLYDALESYFMNEQKELNITLRLDVENNCVCLSRLEYNQWQNNIKNKKPSYRKMYKRVFTFDKDNNLYISKKDDNETLKTLRKSITKRCRVLSLSPTIFHINNVKNQIEITEENYKLFTQHDLECEAKKIKAFSAILTKDHNKNVYFHCSSRYDSTTRSFNILARLLHIDVHFNTHNKRTEISVEDYNRWVAHPIIAKSLASANEASSSHPSQQALVKPRKPKKAQTIKNTEGNISAKYLDGAICVPIPSTGSINTEHQSLLSKGYIIPFQSFQSALLDADAKKLSMRKKLRSQGIKADFTIYTSQKESIKDLISKNIVFVRAGRKQEASIPTLKTNEQSVIMVMMTRQEYDEIEQELSFSPTRRLPKNIKLCIIESCSLKNQPSEQAESYLRASNIKRAIAYGIADRFNLKQFVLMDDNTSQIQMAEPVASDNSIDALFELFDKYKAQGTVCATLGSYAPFKNITQPLEATQTEEVNQKLGSKIMYVDFETISEKLKAQNRQLHEILSPCSLWWGEDYFNMLGIIHLIEDEIKDIIMGVVPYSVAWHIRSQTHKNKEKSNSNFQLANAWLSANKQFIEGLSEHQQKIVYRLQEIIAKEIEKQKIKEEKYFEQLEQSAKTENNLETEEIAESKEIPPEELGKQHGIRAAKRGYELDIEKLTKSVNEKYEPDYTQMYIKGFTKGHQITWLSLPQDERAYRRGFWEGRLAAKKGLEADKIGKNKIPSFYEKQADIFLKGFNKGNHLQWEAMKNPKHRKEVEVIARELGSKRASTGFDISEDKLNKVAAKFDQNAAYFKECYCEAFKTVRASMDEEDIIIEKAVHLAKSLSLRTTELDAAKLEQTSRMFGKHYLLYKNTVTTEFEKLRRPNGILTGTSQASASAKKHCQA